jgi:hypothetical protein
MRHTQGSQIQGLSSPGCRAGTWKRQGHSVQPKLSPCNTASSGLHCIGKTQDGSYFLAWVTEEHTALFSGTLLLGLTSPGGRRSTQPSH